MKPGRLLITGASGVGSTTVGRAVAVAWSAPHADSDDYFWVPSDPPYVEQRAAEDRIALMRQVFSPRPAWVLSGSMHGWGDPLLATCEAAVLLVLDAAERMRRLETRERDQRGMVDEAALATFLAWAAGYDNPAFDGRTRVGHERWLAESGLPVLRLDALGAVEDLRDAILAWSPGIDPAVC